MDNQPVEMEAESMVTSPLPKKEVKTLSFPEAIVEIIDGRRITKLEWNDVNIYGFLGTDGHLKINLTDKLADWILSDGDLKGIDYVVLKEIN
jgi:hypothetical protein